MSNKESCCNLSDNTSCVGEVKLIGSCPVRMSPLKRVTFVDVVEEDVNKVVEPVIK